MIDERSIEEIALCIRKKALDLAYIAGDHASHFGAGMSIVDILAVLYFRIMSLDASNPQWEKRDRFILSKGHGVIGYYAALQERGFIEEEELLTFEQTDTFLPGHPVKCRNKGVEFTNGSLGIGLSVAVGVAYALKKKKSESKVFVIIGDGECNEGIVWEALMSAKQFKLDNLVIIVDYNHYQLGGKNECIMSIKNAEARFKGFIENTISIDGHNHKELYDAFTNHYRKEIPLVVIANTIKGKGFSFSENNNDWHHTILIKQKYEEALNELRIKGNEMGISLEDRGHESEI